MQRKTFFIGLAVLMAVLVFAGAFMPDTSDESDLTGELATLASNPGFVSKTVAVCNSSNFCQDYRVICKGGEELSREPVPGATIQKPEGWVDERNVDYSNLCS
jgi:hypothetical protein